MTTYCAPCIADLALMREAASAVGGTACCAAHAVLLTHPADAPGRRRARLQQLRALAESKTTTASVEEQPLLELLVHEYTLAGAMDMSGQPRPDGSRPERPEHRGERPEQRGERPERPGEPGAPGSARKRRGRGRGDRPDRPAGAGAPTGQGDAQLATAPPADGGGDGADGQLSLVGDAAPTALVTGTDQGAGGAGDAHRAEVHEGRPAQDGADQAGPDRTAADGAGADHAGASPAAAAGASPAAADHAPAGQSTPGEPRPDQGAPSPAAADHGASQAAPASSEPSAPATPPALPQTPAGDAAAQPAGE